MLPSGKSEAFCVVITRALRVYPLVLEPPRLICVRGLQGVGGVAFMIVSQKVVIRDDMGGTGAGHPNTRQRHVALFAA